ncbi:MAG: ArsR/SmtB family transcription factor [Phycisphaerae bacterium]
MIYSGMMATRSQGLIPMNALEHAASMMRVLAHPHRLRICDLLQAGDRSVGELAADLDLPPATVSQHLAILRAHGILAPERDGKTVYYRVVHPAPRWLLSCIRRYAVRGHHAPTG